MRRWFAAALALLLLLAALLVKDILVQPPALRPPSAGAFDTGRAVARLERILGGQQPHPVDSAANDAVRERLVEELRALGLTPRITDDFACNGSAKGRSISCARIRNVVASIGPDRGRHLLLVSHYDSTPVGPGAADDGIGVAVMLEVAAHLQGLALARPVTLLFDEGEESGLLGARAFLDRDPLAGRVDTILNFEARGVEGPAIMFETSVPNGPAIARYAAAVDRPAVNSLSTAIYKLIPNSTDVAVFEETKGWTILNFAVIGNESRYHTAGDTLAALSRRSVQHLGDQALAVTLESATGAAPAGTGSKVFTDLLGRAIIVVPATPAVAGVVLLLLMAAVLAWRRPGSRRAFVAAAGALLGAAALVFLIETGARLLSPGDYWRAFPILIELATYATAMAAAVLLLLWARRDRPQLRAAFWLLFLVVGALLSVVIPGAAIFFLLPAPLALAGMAMASRLPAAEPAGAIAAALVLALLWAPMLGLAETTLDHDAMTIFAPIAVLILLPFLIELLPRIRCLPTRPLAASLAGAALLAWVGAIAAPSYSLDRKQMFGIEHATDAGSGKARWMIANDGAAMPDAYQAIATFERGMRVPWSSRKRWSASAPGTAMAAPQVRLLSVRNTKAGRRVSLRIAANGADMLILRAPPQARVLAIRANGWERAMGGREREESAGANAKGDNDYSIRCHGRDCADFRLDLLLANRRPVVWTLIGTRSGLPETAKPLVEARPATATAQYLPDATIAYRRIRL